MQAILLFAHGARADDWATPFRAVRDRLRAARPDQAVELAFLEFMSPDFDGGVNLLCTQGATRLLVCPLFLGSGGHVLRELPALIDAARARRPELPIDCGPSLGEDPEMIDAIARFCLRQLDRRTDGPLQDSG